MEKYGGVLVKLGFSRELGFQTRVLILGICVGVSKGLEG